MQAKVSHPCVLSGATQISYKDICSWLLLVLGLEVPRQNQAVKLIWLLLVPSLELTEASCSLFDRIQEVVSHDLRPSIHMEK